MEPYRVLLVDDELEIREGMEEKVSWEDCGYTICGVAENGMEAYEKTLQLLPDVILTDIKMPFVDGLELTKMVLKSMPATRIVVFSGFDDFEYAQEAIKLGVEEYILKPISAKALEESLNKLKIKMDKELASKRNIRRLEQAYEESFPALQEHFLMNIVEGFFSDEEARMKALIYGKEIAGEFKTICIVNSETEKEKISDKNFFKHKEELIPISIKKILGDTLRNRYENLIFHYHNNVVLVAAFDGKEEIGKFTNIINEACKDIKKVININITAGIGNLYRSWNSLQYSYNEALRALDYSILLSKENDFAIYIKDINEEEKDSTLHFDEYRERNLINAIKKDNEREIEGIINIYFGKLKEKRLPYYQYQAYVLEVLSVVLKIMNTYRCDYELIFEEERVDYISTVLSGHSLDYMGEWLISIAKKVAKWMRTKRKDAGTDLVDRAKIYMNENYMKEEFSLDELCDYLHVNPTYFSSVFKKKTGENFIAYLTNLRLSKASYLLDATEDKTYIIAKKVGYSEPNYFSYLFKKRIGMSPTMYRGRGKVGEEREKDV